MESTAYLRHAQAQFRSLRTTAERALAQVDDARFFVRPDEESNSPALLVKHMAGNLLSRWTDFLTTDGEKPDRRRDTEFEDETPDTRESLMRRWAAGWETLFAALAPLDDLDRVVTIRGEPHTVFDAVERQKQHYAYHVGQIVYVAKHLVGPGWKSLSVPRGKSEEFNASKRANARP